MMWVFTRLQNPLRKTRNHSKQATKNNKSQQITAKTTKTKNNSKNQICMNKRNSIKENRKNIRNQKKKDGIHTTLTNSTM